MPKFRKKPIVIDAVQWNGENITEIVMFMHPKEPTHMKGFSNADEIVGIQTLEGLMVANKGDWIIKGVKGEFYPCKPDVFLATYDPISENSKPTIAELEEPLKTGADIEILPNGTVEVCLS